MPTVPDDLRKRFQNWDAKGRPPQEAFEWEKRNWHRYLGDKSILESLPNPIDRAGVCGRSSKSMAPIRLSMPMSPATSGVTPRPALVRTGRSESSA